jgi:hypothetical protein
MRPQNPKSPPMFAQLGPNPQGLDILQVVNPAGGEGIVYRLNEFQASWYAGSGNPPTIPGQLAGNLYLNVTNGDTWLCNGSTWTEIANPAAGVNTINGLNGDVTIVGEEGITVTLSGQQIQLLNTGVTSLNTLTGDISVTPGVGIQVANSGQNIQVSNTQFTIWADIQNYGGVPKPQSITQHTTVNTTGGLPTITVGSALPYFLNGSGVCIWQGGVATSQSTPSAPTVTSPPVSGSQTITYKIVGVDMQCGLTAASSAATVSAPAVFSPVAQAISSITASAGTVTANFAAPLNTTVTAGMTIHIVGVTGSGSGWNGVYTIATAPTTSQITYAVVGATGTGTVTGATGRVSNTQLITAISRNSSGVISVTTSQNHNFNVGTGAQPTIVIIEGVQPYDLQGHFVLATTPTPTTFTCNTGNYRAETGTLNANGAVQSGSRNAASATVWEYTYLACPALSGTTKQYYIYSDNASPGGALNLIGKTLYGESHFTDYGPNYGGGFVAPGYVPTTAPSVAQNQLFSTTILSGQGTTSLTLAANVPSTVTGGTILYDDGPALIAACNAFPTSVDSSGQVVLSPLRNPNSISLPMYMFNSPISIPALREIIVASGMWINETIYLNQYVRMNGSAAANFSAASDFTAVANPILFGLASPMIQAGIDPTIQTTGFVFSNLLFQCTLQNINGQYGLSLLGSNYVEISNCVFVSSDALAGGTNVPLMLNGNCVSVDINNITYDGASVYGDNQPIGQSCWGPCIGNIVVRASDNPGQGNQSPSKIVISGMNTSANRGILIDGQYATTNSAADFEFSQIWNQAPTTPAVMFSGFQSLPPSDIRVHQIVNDSEATAILANWTPLINSVLIGNCETTNSVVPLVTGNYINGLETYGNMTPLVGQNINRTVTFYGPANIGSVVTTPPYEAIQSNTFAQSLGLTGTIFSAFPSTTVTAVATHGGSIPAGTYPVVVTFVGWDGGEGGPNPNILLNDLPVNVTLAGASLGIQVSWTPQSGTQGAYIYINGFRNTTLYTTSPQTFTSLPADHSQPLWEGSGLPLLNSSGLYTPQIVMASGSNELVIATPTMTGNRTMSFCDGANSSVVSTTLTTTLNASPYAVTLQGATSSSHAWLQPANAAAATGLTSAYISGVGTGTVTVVTSGTASQNFNVFATVN